MPSIPFLRNQFPVQNETNANADTLVSVDVLSGGLVKPSLLDAYVNGVHAFSGPSTFLNSFNGPQSAITPTNVDGYDGYHLVLDSYNSFSNVVGVRIDGYDGYDDGYDAYDGYTGGIGSWGFVVGNRVNTVYFGDGQGLKRIDIQDLTGETQAAMSDDYGPVFSEVRTVLSRSTYPTIPDNEISSIFGNLVDGYFCLALSFENNYGTAIVRNETGITRYLDGYNSNKAQINDSGTMYVVNEDLNQIEVYYGASIRDGYRSPDFIYNTTSTPSIISGTINDIHVVSGYSTKLSGATRVYVGTSQGVTRIETYDQGTNGYCDGYDNRGVSIHYGISGSGQQHEIIGGTVSNVVSVDSDDSVGIMFVATNDGSGNGGLTQIAISQSRKIIFMTEGSGFLPSNNIRDVFGKVRS